MVITRRMLSALKPIAEGRVTPYWFLEVIGGRGEAVSPADYLGVGPCFPSSTKSFGEFAAAEFLRTVSREISLPAFAIGGVTLDRLDELAALGITRVAVAAAVTSAHDPAAAAAAIIARLKQLEAENGDGSDFPSQAYSRAWFWIGKSLPSPFSLSAATIAWAISASSRER